VDGTPRLVRRLAVTAEMHEELMVVLCAASTPLWVMELVKWVRHRATRGHLMEIRRVHEDWREGRRDRQIPMQAVGSRMDNKRGMQ